MAVNRVCLALLLAVCLDSVVAKPFFGDWWCDFIVCDDDDDDGTTSTSSTTLSDYDYGCDCRPVRRRTTTTPAPATTIAASGGAPAAVQPTQFNVEIPPDSNGLSISFVNTANGLNIMMVPRPSGNSATTTSATTTVVTTTAGGTTAGGATAAGTTDGGSTTTAADSTTAAATTAAA